MRSVFALLLITSSGCAGQGAGGASAVDAAGEHVAPDTSPAPDAGPLDAQPDVTDAQPDVTDAQPDGPSDAAWTPVVVHNAQAEGQCDDPQRIFPLLPDEVGHWALERLTPAQAPTAIDHVEYVLAGPLQDEAEHCRIRLPHHAFAFVGPDGMPDPSPSMARDFRMFEPLVRQDDIQRVTWRLEPPLMVEPGEALFVGVEMAADLATGSSLCLFACRNFDGGSAVERSYWGSATTEPYPWADLVVDFGINANYAMRAYGRALP